MNYAYCCLLVFLLFFPSYSGADIDSIQGSGTRDGDSSAVSNFKNTIILVSDLSGNTITVDQATFTSQIKTSIKTNLNSLLDSTDINEDDLYVSYTGKGSWSDIRKSNFYSLTVFINLQEKSFKNVIKKFDRILLDDFNKKVGRDFVRYYANPNADKNYIGFITSSVIGGLMALSLIIFFVTHKYSKYMEQKAEKFTLEPTTKKALDSFEDGGDKKGSNRESVEISENTSDGDFENGADSGYTSKGSRDANDVAINKNDTSTTRSSRNNSSSSTSTTTNNNDNDDDDDDNNGASDDNNSNNNNSDSNDSERSDDNNESHTSSNILAKD